MQANLVAKSIRHNMYRQEQNLLESISNLAAKQDKVQNDVALTTEMQMANFIDSNGTTHAILTLLQEIEKKIKDQKPPSKGSQRLKEYCWTHGCCTHKSSDCCNKKEGHCDNATMRNKMGGSTKNCNECE